jgi:hypothetical protein
MLLPSPAGSLSKLCCCRIWGTPDKKRTYLLLLPEKKLFVILLTRDLDAQV